MLCVASMSNHDKILEIVESKITRHKYTKGALEDDIAEKV